MTFNKKLLAIAVGTTLTAGLGMQAAQADHQLLIPYVVKDTSRTTIVTLIGYGDPVNSGAVLHLQYWTKSTTAANTAACEPNSTTMTFTDNDVVTFDTAGLLGSGPLFGDTTNLAPLGTSISYAGPRHGYLQVENTDDDFHGGYWLEVDLANGGAHGDIAIGSNIDNDGDFRFVSDNISLTPDTAGNNGDARAVVFWPGTTATSAFTVTPLGSAMDVSDNSTVVVQIYNDNAVQGAYDRNENGIDGTVPQTVRCVGRLTAAQLMPGVVANAAWAATGGWGFFTNLGDGDTNGESSTVDLRAVVYQVDTSSAAGAGKFLQNATRVMTDNN